MKNRKHHLKIRLLFTILLLNSSFSCYTVKMQDFGNVIPDKLQYKDSLYLVYTANEWAKVNFDIYNHDLNNSNYATKHPNYKVIRVFYSPDSLKMISWIEIKMENGHGCDRPQGYSFSANAIIGIRNEIKQPWTLYPFDKFGAICDDTEGLVLSAMEQYYFFSMKESSEFVNKIYLDMSFGGLVRYDYEKSRIRDGVEEKNFPSIEKNLGYNLQDKDFWTKSLIWQKGARIKGLYNFQTVGNIPPDYKNPELITPKIIYPDSILRLYK